MTDEAQDPRAEEVIRQFHTIFYDRGATTWHRNTWLGKRAIKSPLDLWIYQEIIFERRPDVIVETGTAHGGTALFLACICQLIDSGRIITVDTRFLRGRPQHERITYLDGSSVAAEIVSAVREAIRPGERVMVILDSDHSRDHVLEELRTYGPMVSEGCHLIVEDTNVNGHPVAPRHGPGPMEAVEQFLAEDDGFRVDREREKFLVTFNPNGFLERIGKAG